MKYVKNQPNNRVVKGFKGIKDFRYHPTKGYRLDKGFDPKPIKSNLENMIVHEEPEIEAKGKGVDFPARTNKKGSMQ